jgi:4-amino-4-deoxy-L-arabinose transferase-like glycosyltransferase
MVFGKGESMVEKRFSKIFHQPWLQIAFLLGFCLVIYFLNLGRWDLWNPDEPRYAQVAREMVDGGDWILMHANGRTYEDKPPLFFWLIAFSTFLWRGFSSFSVRFLSALFGTLTVLLTFFLGRKLYGSRTGFLSALILATSFEFAYLSTRANIDATLTFLTTASLFLFWQWYHHRKVEGGEERDNRSLSIYGFYSCMALATLAKGPVGLVLPLLVSVIYLAIQRDWKAMKRMRLLTGMVLVLVIVLSWYIPAAWKGGQNFINETLLHHTIYRFAKGSSHIRPFYYYFANFPVDFMPWFLFLPGAIVYGLLEKRERIPKEFLFLLVWFVAIFLFFSFSKGKRTLYLLPLYPAVSLLVGKLWDDYLSGSAGQSPGKIWIALPVYLFIIFFFLMGLFLYAVPVVANFSVKPSTPRILKMIVQWAGLGGNYFSYVPRGSIIFFILLLFGSSVLLSLAHGLKYKSIAFTLIVAIMGLGFFYVTRFIFPSVNPYKSARFISNEIIQTIKPGEKLVMYGDFGSVGTAPYNFYTGIVPILEIENEGEVIGLFSSKERVFCLFRYKDYERLSRKDTGVPLHLITRRSVGDKDMALVSNQ